MWLGSLAEYRFCNSPYQLYYVCRMYAEENNKDLLSFALLFGYFVLNLPLNSVATAVV